MVNYLLEHISPLLVSVVLLMEPLFGSLIGFAFDKQGVPGLWTFVRCSPPPRMHVRAPRPLCSH